MIRRTRSGGSLPDATHHAQTIRAIFENGVLVPLDELTLAEREQVRVTVMSNHPSPEFQSETDDPLAGIRVATGVSDLSEKFDDYRFGKRTP